MLYAAVLGAVHRALAARFGLRTGDALDKASGASVPHWPAFPDTADALRRLKARYRLVILSNVDRAGIAASNRKLGVEFDAIHTAEDVGSYKPDARNFAYMTDRLARSDCKPPTSSTPRRACTTTTCRRRGARLRFCPTSPRPSPPPRAERGIRSPNPPYLLPSRLREGPGEGGPGGYR